MKGFFKFLNPMGILTQKQQITKVVQTTNEKPKIAKTSFYTKVAQIHHGWRGRSLQDVEGQEDGHVVVPRPRISSESSMIQRQKITERVTLSRNLENARTFACTGNWREISNGHEFRLV